MQDVLEELIAETTREKHHTMVGGGPCYSALISNSLGALNQELSLEGMKTLSAMNKIVSCQIIDDPVKDQLDVVSDEDIFQYLTDKWINADPYRYVHVENHGAFFVVCQHGRVVENSCRNALELQIKTARLNAAKEKPLTPVLDNGLSKFFQEPECECGAHKIGIENGKAGHSSWCPVRAI
jgi:hypothetical protein